MKELKTRLFWLCALCGVFSFLGAFASCGNCSMRCSRLWHPRQLLHASPGAPAFGAQLLHGPGQPLEHRARSPSPCSRVAGFSLRFCVLARKRFIETRWEPADKPGSVVDSHSSGHCVTAGLKQPTRGPCGPHVCPPIWSCSGWGLPCHACYQARGALLPHHFTLTCSA